MGKLTFSWGGGRHPVYLFAHASCLFAVDCFWSYRVVTILELVWARVKCHCVFLRFFFVVAISFSLHAVLPLLANNDEYIDMLTCVARSQWSAARGRTTTAPRNCAHRATLEPISHVQRSQLASPVRTIWSRTDVALSTTSNAVSGSAVKKISFAEIRFRPETFRDKKITIFFKSASKPAKYPKE